MFRFFKLAKLFTGEALWAFQESNCRGCHFGDSKNIGTSKPCCTFPGIPLLNREGTECLTRVPKLTAREIEVLELIRDGHDNYNIQCRLNIANQTVKNHVYDIYQKLSVSNRAGAVVKALRKKIITLGEEE